MHANAVLLSIPGLRGKDLASMPCLSALTAGIVLRNFGTAVAE